MTNENEQAYWKAVTKWAEKTQVLVKYQQKNMKWFLSPEIVQWFTPSYEREVTMLEREVERLEKEADRLEKLAGLDKIQEGTETVTA
jgi:hypothetical protein